MQLSRAEMPKCKMIFLFFQIVVFTKSPDRQYVGKMYEGLEKNYMGTPIYMIF